MSPSLEEQFEGKTGITPTVNKVDSKRKKKKKKKTKANRPIGPTRAQDFAGQQLVKPQRIVRTVLVGATVISFIAGFISQSLRVTFAIIGGATIFLALFVIPPWPIFNRHPVKRLPVETESYINQDQLVHEAYHKRVSVAGTNTFDAILFGVNKTKPRLIKLPWSHAVNEGLPWQKLDRELWFNSREHFLRTMYVQTFGANGPPLGRTLAIIYDDNFLVNGSPINQCIQNITRGKAVHPWAGNILALRARGMPSDFYSDIVMEEDLAPLIRYFEDYGR